MAAGIKNMRRCLQEKRSLRTLLLNTCLAMKSIAATILWIFLRESKNQPVSYRKTKHEQASHSQLHNLRDFASGEVFEKKSGHQRKTSGAIAPLTWFECVQYKRSGDGGPASKLCGRASRSGEPLPRWLRLLWQCHLGWILLAVLPGCDEGRDALAAKSQRGAANIQRCGVHGSCAGRSGPQAQRRSTRR
jgi:hypothetical protein